MISIGLLLNVFMLSIIKTNSQNTPMNYNFLGVSITLANRGTFTDFYVSTSFNQNSGVDVSDSWLGIGINTSPQMNKANVVICRNSLIQKFVKSYYNQVIINVFLERFG